jgi:hypothetical protein
VSVSAVRYLCWLHFTFIFTFILISCYRDRDGDEFVNVLTKLLLLLLTVCLFVC